jgi:hypothetical protein
MRRGRRLALGGALATIGVAGLIWTGFASQAAPPGSTWEAHEPTSRMTGTTHGARVGGSIQRTEGAERMIEVCTEMMRQGMHGMMGGSMTRPGAEP